MKNLNIDTYEKLQAITLEDFKKYSYEQGDLKDGYKYFLLDSVGAYGIILGVLAIDTDKICTQELQLHYNYTDNTLQAIDRMKEASKRKLFSDKELEEDLQKYTDYNSRIDFLNNSYKKKYNTVSMYTETEENSPERAIKEKGIFSGNLGFCYWENKEDFVKYQEHIKFVSEQHIAKMNDSIEYFKSALDYEFANYEVGYTYSASRALESLGLDLEKFTKEQLKAYATAFEEITTRQNQ